MSLSLNQASSEYNTATVFSSNTITGSLILALAFMRGGTALTGVSDNKGNSYTQLGIQQATPSVYGTSYSFALFYAINGAGVSGWQGSASATGSPGLLGVAAYEFTGQASSSPIDAYNPSTGSGTAITLGNVTASETNEAIVALWVNNIGHAWSTDSFANTIVYSTNLSSLSSGGYTQETASGSYGGTATVSTNEDWGAFTIAVKTPLSASVGGGGFGSLGLGLGLGPQGKYNQGEI